MADHTKPPVWDDWNREHVAKHGVTPAEAAWVMRHASNPYPADKGGGKYLVRGVTRAGRHLQVIFVMHSDEDIDYLAMRFADMLSVERAAPPHPYVIHARELTEREKRNLRRTITP